MYRDGNILLYIANLQNFVFANVLFCRKREGEQTTSGYGRALYGGVWKVPTNCNPAFKVGVVTDITHLFRHQLVVLGCSKEKRKRLLLSLIGGGVIVLLIDYEVDGFLHSFDNL